MASRDVFPQPGKPLGDWKLIAAILCLPENNSGMIVFKVPVKYAKQAKHSGRSKNYEDSGYPWPIVPSVRKNLEAQFFSFGSSNANTLHRATVPVWQQSNASTKDLKNETL